jgi:hypothetical protein
MTGTSNTSPAGVAHACCALGDACAVFCMLCRGVFVITRSRGPAVNPAKRLA